MTFAFFLLVMTALSGEVGSRSLGGEECGALCRAHPPGGVVTSGSYVTQPRGATHDRFHTDGEEAARENHLDKITIPMILFMKFLGLTGVGLIKHFLLKAFLLAKLSLLISGLLILQSASGSDRQQEDLKMVSPGQYPENEPDLSGYGYSRIDGNFNNYDDLTLAAVNRTLASRPEKKWRIVVDR